MAIETLKNMKIETPDNQGLDPDITESLHDPLEGPEVIEAADGTQVVGEKEVSYDLDEIQEFLDLVSTDKEGENQIPEGASLLVYASRNNNPGMPIKDGIPGLLKVLERTNKPKACYVNISSCYPDQTGTLRHKRDLFAACHLVILDDVGTKVPIDKIPAKLNPTYIIESSPRNYQYGYVFKKPITVYEHAQAIMEALAHAELTDCGGLTATKVVRIGAGINGKLTPNTNQRDPRKGSFLVNLKFMDGPKWNPEDLLDIVNLEIHGDKVTWEAIQSGLSPTGKKHNAQYLPLAPVSQTIHGVIDPVLEWLYKNGLVYADSGSDWVTIICPNCHSHSPGGDDTAGYSPVGRGEGNYYHTRGFKCFHDACKDYDIKNFIGYFESDFQDCE